VLRWDRDDSPQETLLSIADQFHRIPNGGIGYELLLRCSRDARIASKLESIVGTDLVFHEVLFNYVGQRAASSQDAGPLLFRQAREMPGSWGSEQDPRHDRHRILYVDAVIAGDCLRSMWWYSKNLHEPGTIERLTGDFAQALQALAAYSRSP
jgi:non-ribosomal peptide synthase protein (TIGR01720 family)